MGWICLSTAASRPSEFAQIGSDTIRFKEDGEISMSAQENVRIVKDFFAAMGGANKQALLALVAEDIEWIIPGEDWPLAGTHRGRAGLAALLQKASDEVETTFPKPPEFVAQGDRVLVVGVATGKIKATNKSFKDDWVFDITIRDRKVTKIREYIDTQALARASQVDASKRAERWPFAVIGSGQTVDHLWITPLARRALIECPTVTEIPM